MPDKDSVNLPNPFIVSGYVSPKYFCDRENETQQLVGDLQNGWNVTLISPRRMGKTGLIKNVFHHLRKQEKKSACIYIDIFGTRNLHEFVQLLGAEMLNEMMNKGEKLVQKLASFFASWRPVFSIDPMTGTPSVSVNIEPSQSEATLKSIFDYMKQSGRECYVAIDEFQQITEYPESGTEAQLRSFIQFLPNVHFIFSGSKQHMMTEMFMSPKRPFFQSTRLMQLTAIDPDAYYEFASKFFKKDDGALSRPVFDHIYNRFEGHTWYVQSVLKTLFDSYKHVDNVQQAEKAILYTIETYAPYYQSIIPLITEKQFSLLKAIAKEGLVKEPTSGDFIQKYNLKGASSVSSALKLLLDKELIYRTIDGFILYDRFMGLWFCHH